MDEREERLRSLMAAGVHGVSAKVGNIWWWFMLRGVLAALLGICALVWPTASFTILTRIVGIYCLVDGLSGLAGVLGLSERGTYLLQVVADLVAGGILLFWPGTSARTLLMVFGAWALFTGISHVIGSRKAKVEETDRKLITGMGGAVAVVGLILLIWPGTGVVAISWVIALAALLLAALLIFLALRLRQLKMRLDEFAPARTAE
jgi:uncharacterized membrane protein HdeD (DUF308 family)